MVVLDSNGWPRAMRPVLMGTHHMVSAGHYLAAAAGYRILEAGGNAIDAGVATGLCINVVQPDLTNVGGVAPIILYKADTRTVETISGLGWWPRAADPDYFATETGGHVAGMRGSVIPSAIDAWLTALARHGSMSFAEVAQPAIDLAEGGFAAHDVMLDMLEPRAVARMAGWPTTRAIFLPDGGPPPLGSRVVQKDLGRLLRMLVEAERGATSRVAGIQAARDRFYTGDIAEQLVRFSDEHGGWLSREDLAEFHVGVEPAVHTNYRGLDVYACGPWCQGPVVLETLNILEGYALSEMERFGPEVSHLILEALKAAFADRDRYFIDPRVGDVPMDGLLARAYAAEWRERIDPARASPGMPEPGDAWRYASTARARTSEAEWAAPLAAAGPAVPDTSYLCVVDRDGNAFSATPSDGITTTPIVDGLGCIISSRGTQSWVDPKHPAALAPGKRPRLTPSPGMVLRDGRLVMPYGTPGNDMQPQAMVQFLVNVIDFGMNMQQAMEAPRLATFSFPRSSEPHPYTPGLTHVEARVGAELPARLSALGHQVELWPEWSFAAGSLGAVRVDPGDGTLHAGADPRRIAYAIGR